MLSSARPARRAVVCAIGTGAIAGAMLFGAAATASAITTVDKTGRCSAK